MNKVDKKNAGRVPALSDLDRAQMYRDYFLTANRFHLDDRFVLRDGKTHPFAVLCPGGGYATVCSFVEGTPIAKELNQHEFSVFIVYYRVRGKARFPHPQDDLARAINEILQHTREYSVDPDNYTVWGASAGGHLAASFGTMEMGYAYYGLPKPRAIILSYPVISMDKSLTHRGTHYNLLGRHATAAQEEATSVERHITADYPPTYLWCGDADTVVRPENTKRMAEALNKVDVIHQCEIFPGVPHGAGLATGTSAEGWIEHAVQFCQNLHVRD